MKLKTRKFFSLFLITSLFFTGCAGDKGNPTATAEAAGVITGTASWYGKELHGRRTASGEAFDMNKLTAAHRTLAFGTRVEVTNLSNGRRTTVTINDRGPSKKERVIDVSQRAALELGMLNAGLAQVSLRVVGAP